MYVYDDGLHIMVCVLCTDHHAATWCVVKEDKQIILLVNLHKIIFTFTAAELLHKHQDTLLQCPVHNLFHEQAIVK
jgi:hypothetical protein